MHGDIKPEKDGNGFTLEWQGRLYPFCEASTCVDLWHALRTGELTAEELQSNFFSTELEPNA